jgi:class 3 adenylate cyclase
MTERIDRYEGEVLKFVGDAILSAHKDKETAIELAKKLVEFYKLHLKVQFQYTNLVAIISCPEILLKGFSGGSAYMDYSYWGTGLNSLFKAAKEAEEGRVWFLEKGTLMPC